MDNLTGSAHYRFFTTEHPKLRRDLQYLRLGDGPYWALYRPYHLTSLETPISIARAVMRGETTVATDKPPVAESVTIAKKRPITFVMPGFKRVYTQLKNLFS